MLIYFTEYMENKSKQRYVPFVSVIDFTVEKHRTPIGVFKEATLRLHKKIVEEEVIFLRDENEIDSIASQLKAIAKKGI
jgi:hypothetical protein